MKKILITFASIILLTNCVEEFSLNLNLDQHVVVQGLITDSPGPYFVRLTYSNADLNTYFFDENAIDKSIPIKNATVIISDNDGVVDTLIPAPVQYIDIRKISIENGYYQTTRTTGTIGKTYSLSISVDDKIYYAESKMLECPNIDTITCKLVKGPPGKDDGFIPVVFFPVNEQLPCILFKLDFIFDNKKNSYENNYKDNFIFFNSLGVAAFPSREIIPTQTNVYSFYNQTTLEKHQGMFEIYSLGEYELNVYSISNKAYLFYKIAFEQLTNDGGNFKVSPATPPGNISNNALGFFHASAIKKFKFRLPNFY